MSDTSVHVLDLHALHGAVDNVRRFRGTSWRQIARETGLSASTLNRIGQGRGLDADALVSLLVWLGHTEGLGKFIARRST